MIRSKSTLKEYFDDESQPSGDNFGDFIETTLAISVSNAIPELETTIDLSLLTDDRVLQTPDDDGIIATQEWVGAQNYLTALTGLSAGGDLGGTYPDPTVEGIKGEPVPTLATGLLKYTGSAWDFDNSTYLTTISGISAGGDLGGTYPNPTVDKIKSVSVPTLAAGFLKYTGSAWSFDSTTYLTAATTNLTGGAQYKFPRKSSATDWAYEFVNAIEVSDAVRVATKKVTMGTWNMDSNVNIDVAHGLSSTQWKKIRDITGYIRNDADDAYYVTGRSSADGVCDISIGVVDATNIRVARATGGFFDNTSFNDTGFDRGYLIITYDV